MLHVDVDDTTALVGCTRARARDLTQERIGAQCISHELAAEVRGYDKEDDEDGEELGGALTTTSLRHVVHLSDIDREPLAQGGG